MTGTAEAASPALGRLDGRHRVDGGNALRAAVLGANDGLVSNLSLVMGVAGASLPSRTILITGIAGLLAGACSMAMGEWISVTSSRELSVRQIELERAEPGPAPVDPRDLGGSAWTAAIASFIPFVLGALAPVLPFVFLSGTPAVGASLAASALGLFAIGAAITLFTGRPAVSSGVRQLLIGLAAAAVTYGIGAAVGVSVAG
jgi:VIT1/CCC1 family predicted Fe2+/Mn2+ transporter